MKCLSKRQLVRIDAHGHPRDGIEAGIDHRILAGIEAGIDLQILAGIEAGIDLQTIEDLAGMIRGLANRISITAVGRPVGKLYSLVVDDM